MKVPILRKVIPRGECPSVATTMLVVAACSVATHDGYAQRRATPSAPLVFDGVTVVDVAQGTLVPSQRVVLRGPRIQAVGGASLVPLPAGAQVIDARGKYLIPGLWDMHVHPERATAVAYPLFLANGVTGIRDAGSPVPLDTLRRWRQQILAGSRVGPPRQLLSGQSVMGPVAGCRRSEEKLRHNVQTCVIDATDAVRYVDSLKAAGADMIKPREVDTPLYFAMAAEARRLGLPFGGHATSVTEVEASDSGARIIDHQWGDADCGYYTIVTPPESLAVMMGLPATPDNLDALRAKGANGRAFKDLEPGDATWETCQRTAAARFRRNGTWFVPTFLAEGNTGVHLSQVWQRGDIPLLVGTDETRYGKGVPAWGRSLHDELASYVASGMTPVIALRTATLNPATMLHATDSLGTVAPGKLADLVLLDANPLADIANTRAIRAVVANGRYFDRTALDALLAEGEAAAQRIP